MLTRLGLTTVVLVVSAMLAACGGTGSNQPTGQNLAGGNLTANPGSFNVPRPADAARQASANAVQRMRGGGEYIPSLKANAGDAGQYLGIFEPEWNGETTFSPAWAVYSFYLPDYAEGNAAWLAFSDGQQLPAGGTAWVGLSDWAANTWRWYPVDTEGVQSQILEVPGVPVSDYISGDDGSLLMCFLTLEDAVINGLGVGASFGPVAVPIVNDSLTESDTVSSFDGTHSFSEFGGDIVYFEWDVDSDGSWDHEGDFATAGIVDSISFTPGYHEVTLRVTDENGGTATASATVLCWDTFDPPAYNEVEDNDTSETAQQLPGVPFTGFTANIGEGGANDGDIEDWYTFETYFDTKTWVWLQMDNAINLYTELYDQYGNIVNEAGGPGSFINLETQLTAGRYFLKVDASRTMGQETDYTLEVNDSFPNEAPVAFLNALPATLAQGDDITLMAHQSYDPDGDVVEYWFDLYGDGHYERQGTDTSTDYSVERTGDFMATVLVKDDNGATGTYSVPISVTGGQPYDEVEQNDRRSEAMPLAGFPDNGIPSFTGDIGDGGGNDGDDVDVYSFQISQAGSLTWILNTLDTEHGVLEIALSYMDGDDNVFTVAKDQSGNAVLAIGEDVTNTAVTYFITVRTTHGSSRYDFSLHFTPL